MQPENVKIVIDGHLVKIVFQDDETVIHLDEANESLTQREYKTFLNLLRNHSKGKKLKKQEFEQMMFFLSKSLIMQELPQEEKNEIKGHLEHMDKMRKTLFHFGIAIVIFLLVSIGLLVSSAFYPALTTALNIFLIVFNIFCFSFMIYLKEFVYKWDKMNRFSKFLTYSAILINMILAANGIVNLLDLDLLYWFR